MPSEREMTTVSPPFRLSLTPTWRHRIRLVGGSRSLEHRASWRSGDSACSPTGCGPSCGVRAILEACVLCLLAYNRSALSFQFLGGVSVGAVRPPLLSGSQCWYCICPSVAELANDLLYLVCRTRLVKFCWLVGMAPSLDYCRSSVAGPAVSMGQVLSFEAFPGVKCRGVEIVPSSLSPLRLSLCLQDACECGSG